MNKAIQFLKQKYNAQPLLCILIIAAIPRILAAIFSKGYAMHDDMFGPVQAMQDMLDDYSTIENDTPRLMLYPLVQYIVFAKCEFFGIYDPQIKMYFVRFLHAFYSLFVVFLGYKITQLISDEKNARTVGIILALLWILPFMSVHNLVETFSIPPLLAGVYYVLKYYKHTPSLWSGITYFSRHCGLDPRSPELETVGAGFACPTMNDNKGRANLAPTKPQLSDRRGVLNTPTNTNTTNKYLLFAGLFFAFAFAIRFQTAFVPFGIGIVMLFYRQFKSFAILALSTIFIVSLFLAIPDYIFWEKPFGSLINYLDIKDMGSYPTNPWYMTTLLVVGVLIPPMGMMLFWGYLRNWKKHILLFLPVLIFIAFHSIYPNKQERFILTILPLFIILGVIGWNEFVAKSEWWQNRKKLLKINWIWFWFFNSILLIIFTFSYSKKTRVESLTYLSDKQVSGIVFELNESNIYFAPTFYLGKNRHKPTFNLNKNYLPEEIEQQFNNSKEKPNYAIFFDEGDLSERVERFEKNFNSRLDLIEVIEPGLLDKILHFSNPKHNRNYTAYIYEIKN